MTDHDIDPLKQAIGRLAATGHRPSWPDGKELRQRATRRRRRRLAGGSIGAVAVVAAAAVTASVVTAPAHRPTLSAAGPSTTATPPSPKTSKGPSTDKRGDANVTVSRQPAGLGAVHLVATVHGRALPVEATTTAGTLARDETSFALALTKQLAGGTATNVVDSPLSADMALSMLELGASGATRAGIAKALSSATLSAAEQATGWAQLQASLRATPAGDTLNVANSAWLQKGVSFVPAYLAQLAQSFGDDAYQADFARHNRGATAAINAWVSAQTDGRITQLFAPGSLSPATVLVLANALHFKAAWDPSLDMGVQAPERFATPTGTTITPSIGAQGASLSAVVTKAYTSVAVPYQGGRYQALVVQPDASTLTDFLDGLDATGLDRIVRSLHTSTVNLTMPSLSLSATRSLNQPLAALGMASAFGPSADLSGIAPQAAHVAAVEQADRLIVDKAGTDASAATGVVSSSSAVRAHLDAVTITIKRPYLLLLRDTKTGLILMATAIETPAGS
jgi:serpin B